MQKPVDQYGSSSAPPPAAKAGASADDDDDFDLFGEEDEEEVSMLVRFGLAGYFIYIGTTRNEEWDTFLSGSHCTRRLQYLR